MSTQVDLTRLPPPQIIDEPEFEDIVDEMRSDLRTRVPGFTAGQLESDPAVKLLEALAYREVLLRGRINRACRAVMLAHATGSDLDNIAALFGVKRQVVDEGDPQALPPRAPVYERDGRLRRRTQTALESFSTAGTVGGYVHHALSASPLVHDVAVSSPEATPGTVRVAVMSTEGDGQPSAELLQTVRLALSHEDVRPLTDKVEVVKARRIATTVVGTLTLYRGPQSDLAVAAAKKSLTAFLAQQKRLGEPLTIDGLHAALRVEGVKKIALTSPSGNIEPNEDEYVDVTSTREITETQA